MGIYINGSSCISAQDSFSGNNNTEAKYFGTAMRCIEPQYNSLLDPKLTRRMSRVIKMGMVTALDASKKGGSPTFDAIITGTGLGCLEDTGNFLLRMSDSNNRSMNPTAFIQSTHNTVGSLIALHLGNKGYNSTYSHLDVSFENALQDAMLALKHNEASNVLVGAFDELTDTLLTLYGRLNYTRKEEIYNTELFNTDSVGTLAGEGCAYFALSDKKSSECVAEITDLQLLYKPTNEQLSDVYKQINNKSGKSIILTGKNGDANYDAAYKSFEALIETVPSYNYKHLCGAYPTASAFAMWLAIEILKGNNTLLQIPQSESLNNVYIYNCSHQYHSIICISKC